MPSAASGGSASMIVPSPSARRTTLHGSRAPTDGSASRARLASGGLQAPRMTYGARSMPSRARGGPRGPPRGPEGEGGPPPQPPLHDRVDDVAGLDDAGLGEAIQDARADA